MSGLAPTVICTPCAFSIQVFGQLLSSVGYMSFCFLGWWTWTCWTRNQHQSPGYWIVSSQQLTMQGNRLYGNNEVTNFHCFRVWKSFAVRHTNFVYFPQFRTISTILVELKLLIMLDIICWKVVWLTNVWIYNSSSTKSALQWWSHRSTTLCSICSRLYLGNSGG